MSENDKTENNKSHCLKCKSTQDIKDAEVKISKNNRSMLCGICVQCGTKCCRFLKKEKSEISKKLEEYLIEDKKVDDNVDDKKDDTVKDKVELIEKKIKNVKRKNIKKQLE